MNTLTRFINVRLSAREYKLIRKFAETNRMNTSQAVRGLLADSFAYMKKGEFGGGEVKTPSSELNAGLARTTDL